MCKEKNENKKKKEKKIDSERETNNKIMCANKQHKKRVKSTGT